MERYYKLLLIIGVSVFAILIVGLVLADVLSTPTAEFSFDEDISNNYTFILNKSGIGSNVNFTWINITLPNNFTFEGYNATNSTGSPTFSTTTNASGNIVLMWNSTTPGVMEDDIEKTTFSFNATSPYPGNYTIWILTLDNATKTNTTHLHVSINDTTAPNVSVTYPVNGSSYSSSSINFNITVLDYDMTPNGGCWVSIDDGDTNLTLLNTTHNDQYNATNTTVPEGNYVAKFWCNDTANNVNNSELVSFTIDTTSPEMSITYPTNNTNYSTGNLSYNFTEINPGFCWYSNDSGITNSTTVAMGTNWTGLSVAEGDRNWTVYCNDSANNLNSTIIIFFTMDTIAPSVSHACSPTTISFGGKVTCTCQVSDTGGTEVSSSSFTQYPTTQVYGPQTTTCTATDYAGNSASSTITYHVIGGGGGGGASSGPGGYQGYDTTFVEDAKEFSEIGKVTRSLSKKHRMRIKIDTQAHYIGVKELTETTATIEVSSTPQEIVFNIGNENKFDVTEDGYYDLKVKLNSIVSEKANITIESIHEKIPEVEEEVGLEEKVEEELKTLKENPWKIWAIIGIILIIIVAGYYILIKKK